MQPCLHLEISLQILTNLKFNHLQQLTDSKMDKKATHIDGLYYAQGDIFDLDGGKFDAIIVFMEPGFNNIQGEFL